MTGYDVDVVVAGGGPVGLMLACELRLGGASVLVLERLTEVDPTIKAGALNAPSVVALYRRGLLPALKEAHDQTIARMTQFVRGRSPEKASGEGPAATGDNRAPGDGPMRTPPRFAGHFAGIMLRGDLLDETDPELGGLGPAAGVGLVAQQDLERILGARAAELGAEVRRGVEVTGFEADDDGVTVTAGGERVRARWLVGCDGGRSTVRKLAGFDFPGTGPEITAYQALAEMEGTQDLRLGWNATPTGVYTHGPVPGRILTVEFDGHPADRTSPVTAEELQGSIRRVTGADVVVKAVVTATRFTDNARQATTYRMGRVLLAGDAAHVHSPFGGQGLNLGLGDAMNLGWKLAAVARGHAPEALLDTYTAERHPIGAWVLDWTRAQIALMRPDPHARALRAVVDDLLATVAGTTHVVKRISGVWQRYDLPGDHPLTGRSAPDFALADGSRLADHLRGGRALLIAPPGLPLPAIDGDRVTVIGTPIEDEDAPRAVLVRPDGYVAWAADTPDPAGLERALATWFGAPATVGGGVG
ncbi:FAD-dependent monooxygenase [Microbispora corallina]|uniref:FAD-dependent oxidoreductase n=1 Tax=Microbispora corallina TaxID=83302 RepID=A0ABQ4G9J2_9ACTN|nr:FAD-dependent monooxygenase [Microbispora corallina]GIH43701.1 FAD-dependent oxidoreductase [Microbispora corallina]